MSRFKIVLVTAVFTLSGAVATLLLPTSIAAAPTQKPCTQRTFRTSTTKDDCVGYIQNMLNIAGGAKLNADRQFGSKTKAAVQAWQSKKKIVVDGIVGPETWYTLCAVNDAGSEAYKTHKTLVNCNAQLGCTERRFSTSTNKQSYCVAYIQGLLNLANGAKLETDSKYGSKTRAAVVAWQKKQKTTDNNMRVDGIVGPQTWKTLCNHKMPTSTEQVVYDAGRSLVSCE